MEVFRHEMSIYEKLIIMHRNINHIVRIYIVLFHSTFQKGVMIKQLIANLLN
jgi:hypothetical protein